MKLIQKPIAFLSGFLIFSCLFYGYFEFQFGDNNNREELPLIYEKITSSILFPNDHFVTEHTTKYTQITPFLSFFSLLLADEDISLVKPTFIILHFLTLSLLFYILHSFLFKLYRFPPLFSALFVFLVSLIIDRFIPAGRWLFINFFDPEWLTITIIFGFFYLHLTKHYIPAFILISIAGILYPIYIIPIFPTIIYLIIIDEFKSSKKKAIQLVIAYASIPAAYSIFLWLISKQSSGQTIDASYIMEYIRAPWHYKIPSIHFINKKSVGYLIFILPFLYFGRKLKLRSALESSLYQAVVGIFVSLLIISIIHSVVRIPLIVQIAPYRIGLFATTFGFLLIPAVMLSYFSLSSHIFGLKLHRYYHLALIALSFPILVFLLNRENQETGVSPEIIEVREWIKENTGSDDLFLNYSDLAIRTQCLRSSFFEFKTIPLTADGQIEWYSRYLLYNGYNHIISPEQIAELFTTDRNSEIKYFGISKQDKFNVLDMIPEKINYIITTRQDSTTMNSHTPIFANSSFCVFKIEK